MAKTRELTEVVDWLDALLETARFADESNNGLQIGRTGARVSKVAFGVDASLAFLSRAAAWGADLCVVHHGLSWGGGIRRLTGAAYAAAKTAIGADMALYASHLPLDANRACGNNWEIARYLGLKKVRPAFAWRGTVIGVVGEKAPGRLVGVCSGGGGSFAPEAKELGCALFVTGEADWAETIAAENAGMPMLCAGHYETEIFGVRALSLRLARELGVETKLFLRETKPPCC